MKESARIEEVLDKLRQVWQKDPDLRLGQIIVMATKPRNACTEVFHIHDYQLLQGLDEFAQKLDQHKCDNALIDKVL